MRYNSLADRSWSRAKFIARPLCKPWPGNLQPVLAVSFSRLLVAAGTVIYSYAIRVPSAEGYGSRLVYEGSYSFKLGPGSPERDVTSIAFVHDGAKDHTVSIGFEDGCVEQLYLPPHRGPTWRQRVLIKRAPQKALHFHGKEVVCLSYSRNSLLSLSSWGSIAFTDLSSPSASAVTVQLGVRSWSSHLCMTASTPYAAFGITCTTHLTPLLLHYITPSGLLPTASLLLNSPRHRPSAVYGIARPAPSSPLGSSDHVIVSGWYDGAVRVHDLRADDRVISDEGTTLNPVLTLYDPWSPEPVYSVSCGGGSASFVAAGTARYSVVAFWDVRQPTKGWSVHAPGNDPSPVYSVVLESSRMFGVTQSRSFVYDFGPGVTKDTYPFIPVAGDRLDRQLKPKGDGIDFCTLIYNHTGLLV